MKISLCLLVLSLTTAASAAPLPPVLSQALGAGVAVSNQRPVMMTPSLSVALLSLRPAIAVRSRRAPSASCPCRCRSPGPRRSGQFPAKQPSTPNP